MRNSVTVLLFRIVMLIEYPMYPIPSITMLRNNKLNYNFWRLGDGWIWYGL